MKRLLYNVVLIFNRIVIVFPFIMGIVLSLIYIMGGWIFLSDKYGPSHFFLPKIDDYFLFFCGTAFSVVIVFIFVKMLLLLYNCFSSKWNKLVVVIVVFIVTAGIRLAVIYLCKNALVPASDIQRIWEIAHNNFDEHIDYYSLFPAYLNYSIVQRIIIAVFDSFIGIVSFDALLCALIAVGIYFIADEICDNNHISIFASAAYALMPSNIMYVLNGSPDFITITFDTYAILLIIKAFNNQNNGKYLMFFLGGALLGVANSYKAFGTIIMIALIIVIVLKAIIDSDYKSIGKRVVVLTLVVMIIAIGFRGTEGIIEKGTENVYGMEIDSRTATPHFLLVGLNTKGEGQIHLGEYSREYYETYLRNGKKYSEAKDHAFKILKDDWKNNTRDIPFLIAIKTVWGWQDDVIPLVYLKNENINLEKKKFNLLLGSMQSYYFLLLIFALIGCIVTRKGIIDFNILFMKLIIFGYFCLLLVSEAQSRYKSLVMPYICLFAAIGIKKIIDAYHIKRGLCNER